MATKAKLYIYTPPKSQGIIDKAWLRFYNDLYDNAAGNTIEQIWDRMRIRLESFNARWVIDTGNEKNSYVEFDTEEDKLLFLLKWA